jgi:hypothetical protein
VPVLTLVQKDILLMLINVINVLILIVKHVHQMQTHVPLVNQENMPTMVLVLIVVQQLVI